MYHRADKSKSLACSLGTGMLALSGFCIENATAQGFLAAAEAVEASQNSYLINDPVFKKMSSEEQQSALNIYSAVSPVGQFLFVKLLHTNPAHLNGSLLAQKDFFGATTLENIEKNCLSAFHPKFEPKRNMTIESFFRELMNAGDLNQACYDVCGTSSYYLLLKFYPAEAARLVGGMLSPEGKANLLMPGKMLIRPQFALVYNEYPGQSLSEHLIFSSFMEFGNGEDEHFCDVCDKSFNTKDGRLLYGLPEVGQLNLIKALYNLRDDEAYVVFGNQYFKCMVDEGLPGYVPVKLRWGEVDYNHAFPDSLHNLTLLEPHWDKHLIKLPPQDNEINLEMAAGGKISTYHMVTALEIKDGRVYYHNLHGPSSMPNGTELHDPPRRIEDNSSGLESMEYDEFSSRFESYIVPQRGKKVPVPRLLN